MPYDGCKIETIVKGYPIQTKWSYLAALWHYWRHTKCQGLPDDDEYLPSVCDCPVDQWPKVKKVVFSKDPFFERSDDGMWHCRWCAEMYAAVMLRYSSIIERSRLGVLARTKGRTSGSTTGSTTGHPLGEPIEYNRIEDHKHTNKEGFPTLQEVKSYASMQNIQEADAEKFWHHFESTGWIDKNGHAVVRWQSKLIGWRTQAQTVELSGNSNGHGTGSVKLIVYSKELDRVNEAIRKIVDGASRDAFGTAMYDPSQKDKLMKLKSRRKELQGILGVTI